MPRARSLAPVPCSLQWARIGVIMVACSWHDALGADQLPREIVGNWCLEIERMLPETYAYRRCKDSSYHIIVRPDGFDAQETSCEAQRCRENFRGTASRSRPVLRVHSPAARG